METLLQVLRLVPLQGDELSVFASLSKSHLLAVDYYIDEVVRDRLRGESGEYSMDDPRVKWWLWRNRRLLPRVISTLVRSLQEDALRTLLETLEFEHLYEDILNDCGYRPVLGVRTEYTNINWIMYTSGTLRRQISHCIDTRNTTELDLWMTIPVCNFPEEGSPLMHAIWTENQEMVVYMTTHPQFYMWANCYRDFGSVYVCTKVKEYGGTIPFYFREERLGYYDFSGMANYIGVEDIPAMLELGMPIDIMEFQEAAMFMCVLSRCLDCKYNDKAHLSALEAFCAHGAVSHFKDELSVLDEHFYPYPYCIQRASEALGILRRYGCEYGFSEEFMATLTKNITEDMGIVVGSGDAIEYLLCH